MKAHPTADRCAICEKPTDKCCSLCRKVFYCNGEHQEVDWHMRHKFSCQGRAQAEETEGRQREGEETKYHTNDPNFMIYSQHMPQQEEALRKEEEYQKLCTFLSLLESRLLLRHKVLAQVAKITERSPQILLESIVRQAEQLMELSTKITKEEYQPSYSRKITQSELLELGTRSGWADLAGTDFNQLSISDVGVCVEYVTDNLLMLKVYHLCGMQKEARQLIIGLGSLLEQPDQERLFLQSTKQQLLRGSQQQLLRGSQQQLLRGSQQQLLRGSQQQLLKGIIRMSEVYNIDKTTETMYRLFIKRVEQSEGIWEQIYAYFNIAVWYSQKTYYDKANKAFTYALELLDSHKKNVKESVVFKADCFFNIALGCWAQRDKIAALQNMQEAYRWRVNSIGKNSMEASDCLMKLAQWYKEVEKWNQCLQYLDECHRVRKLFQDQPEHADALEQTKFLVTEVYEQLSSKKQKSLDTLDPQSRRYYEGMLEKESHAENIKMRREMEESEALPKDSFTSRLFRDDREFVNFKVNITPEMFDTYSTDQLQYLNELIDLTDERMEKPEAIRILVESRFVSVLDEEQRQQFMRANTVE